MKLAFLTPRSTRRLFIVVNGLFWLLFAIYFVAKSYAYRPHIKVFEEESPPYIFWGRALPVEQYMSPLMRVTRAVQAPSFHAASPFFSYFDKRGIVVDHLYLGISVGGYYLVAVCLISFVQWYLLGAIIDAMKGRTKSARETVA
ncbi:MAG TPA: hypothetical protein VJN89_18405 [Candidatus Acidoferrum sp.]|nr:hypothetical protein [Candidatus Acidoferrum sp.]